MKTHACIAALTLMLVPAAVQAQDGNSTLIGGGSWATPGIWSSSPSGFAPNNGNDGRNWNATVNTHTVTLNSGVNLQNLTFNSGGITIGGNSLTLLGNDSLWAGGNISVNGGTLNNNGITTIGNASSVTFTGGGSGGAWNNNGALIKQGGGVLSFSWSGYHNTGTTTITQGRIQTETGSWGTSDGEFTIAGGAEFRVNGGNHTFNENVRINGAGIFNVTAGTATFNGVNIGSDGNLGIGGGTLRFATAANFTTDGGFVGTSGAVDGPGAVTFNGASTWSGGNQTNTGTTHFQGGVNITANGQTVSGGHTVNLSGVSSFTTGSAAFNLNGGTLRNTADGTLTVTNATTLSVAGGGSGGTFANAGNLEKTGAGILSMSYVGFHNDGNVTITEGRIQTEIGSSGTSGGDFTIANGAEFRVNGGSHTFNSTTQVYGEGIFNVTAGTATFNGTSTGSDGNLGIGGGTLSFAAAASFTTDGGFVGTSGAVGGAGTVIFKGASEWSGGNQTTLGGVTHFDGGVDITANGQILDRRTVNLSGSSSLTTGSAAFNLNGGTLRNTEDGTLTVTNATTLSVVGGGAGGTFANVGMLEKNGAGTLSVTWSVFDNTGTVKVNAGSLTTGTGSHLSQQTGSTLTGGNWQVLNGASLVFNSGNTGSNLTTIASGASVMLDGAASTFNKLGPVTASTLTTNQGVFTLKNDRDITTASAFANSGAVTVQDSTTAFKIGTTGNLAYTQTAGETVLVGGALIDASVFNLNGGALKGDGTIASSVITSGSTTIAPGQSPGMMTIDGSLTLSAGNTLAMEIGGYDQGGMSGYDYLDVNGVLTLAGLLDLDMLNGLENAVLYGDIFTLATADSAILGAFSNVASGSRLWTNTHIAFDVWYGAGSSYGENNLVITGAPEPTRAMLMLLGLTGLMLRRRRQATAAA